MSDTEKRMLAEFGSSRMDCLAQLAGQLQHAEDRELQEHILNVITRVCNFETDTMFEAYVQEIREEVSSDDKADEV